MTIKKRIHVGDNIHSVHPCSCLTPDLILNGSDIVFSKMTLYSKFEQNDLKRLHIFADIPYGFTIFHNVSLCTLPNAFLNTMKLMYSGICHSIHSGPNLVGEMSKQFSLFVLTFPFCL